MGRCGLYIADFFEGSGFGHIRRYEAFESILKPNVLHLATQDELNLSMPQKTLTWSLAPKELNQIVEGYDFIVFDSFCTRQEIIDIVENHRCPIFIDDYVRRCVKSGMVIDSTIHANNWRDPAGEIWLYGEQYAIVRPQFYRDIMQPPIKYNFLFTFGGQDTMNFLPTFYKKAPKKSIFIGTSQYPSFATHSRSKRIFWDLPLNDYIQLIMQSEQIISTAGQTLYELMVLGKEFTSIVFCDNHREDGYGFEDYGMPCVSAQEVHEATLSEVLKRIDLTRKALSGLTTWTDNRKIVKYSIETYLDKKLL